MIGTAVRLVAAMAFAATSAAQAQEAPAVAEPSTQERPAHVPAANFAAKNLFSTSKLSPDGSKFAVRASLGGTVQILLIDLEAMKPIFYITVQKDQELEWFRWAGNDRIVMSISSVGQLFDAEVRITRLHSFDFATRTIVQIGRKTDGPIGDDVLFVDPEGRYLLLSVQKSIYEWPSVWRMPLEPGTKDAPVLVQKERSGIWDRYADDAGTVRVGLEYGHRKVKVWYRRHPVDDLDIVVKAGADDIDEKVWDVARIFSGSDEGYTLEKAGETVALRKFNYATRTAGEIVYQNEQWDVTAVDIGEDGHPTAAYFTDDKERIVWLDPKMKELQARLEKALPGQDIFVISRARDDSRMLVFAGREDDPGALYAFDAKKRSLAFIANYRPSISHSMLARPRPVRFTARDATAIHGYLTLPRGRAPQRLPLIIMPHGGPYGVRDTLTYNDEVQFLANRGYAVLQPNYRGSGGYGEAFEELGDGQIGRRMQDDLDDAMDWAVKQGVADPGRVCVVGGSYGGYAALWAVIRNPDRYRCAASFAGVTDLKRWVAYSARRIASDHRKDWRSRVVGEDPSFDLDSVSPARQAATLKRPVLLAHGDKDTRVPFSQFKAMRDAARRSAAPVEELVFEGEGHGFGKSENEQRWYEALEAFLARNNPAD